MSSEDEGDRSSPPRANHANPKPAGDDDTEHAAASASTKPKPETDGGPAAGPSSPSRDDDGPGRVDPRKLIESDSEEEEDDEIQVTATSTRASGKRARRGAGDDEEELEALPSEGSDDEDSAEGTDSERDEEGEGDDDEEEEDEEEEDEDEDEEEEEEEEEGGGRGERRPRKKRRRRNKARTFLDTEAAVDEDEDEDEEDLDDYDNRNEEEAAEAERIRLDRSIYQQADRRRAAEQEELAAEEIAEMLTKRYGSRYLDNFSESSHTYVQRKLVDRNPTEHDPTMFMIKCANGHEQDIVAEVTKKVLANQWAAQAYQIHSIFYKENIKGHIYVEARRKQDVLDALMGVSYIYLGKGGAKVQILSPNEYAGLLVIKKPELKMKPGDWVRFNKGKYLGDLAQVLEVMPESEKVVVKVVPRVEAIASAASGAVGKAAGKRKKTPMRPPAKLFNPRDPQYGNKVSQPQGRSGQYYYAGEYFDNQGYAIKTMSLRSFDTNIPAPTFDERQAFTGGSGIDVKNLTESDRSLQRVTVDDFVVGEGIRVVSGAMQGATGTVAAVDKDLVQVKLEVPGISDPLPATLKPEELSKNFSIGEHVRVVNGQYIGETGLVVEISGNTALIIADGSRKSIEVFTNYLRLATEATVGSVNSSIYAAHDLVEFGAGEVGCVVQIQNDVLTILDSSGNIRKVSARDIARKRDSAKAVSTDAKNAPIAQGDTVILSTQENEAQPKAFQVLHIHRTVVFLHSRDQAENGGVVIQRPRDLVVRSKKDVKGGRPASMGPPSAPPNGSRYGQQFATPGAPARPFGGSGAGGGPNGGKPYLLNKSVSITRGPQKGYVGIVKAVMGDEARVELHSTAKTVKVKVELLAETDANGKPIRRAQSTAGSYAGSGNYNPRMGGATPSYGGGGSTPAWAGGRTPGYAAGSRTPGYDMGNRTPGYDFGNRTPAADYGSRTPAWDAGGRTPAWDAGSKTPAWDAGSKTPAWDSGSRTPAWAASREPGYDSQRGSYRGSEHSMGFVDTPYVPQTPGDTTNNVGTPYVPQTPGAFPQTPGASYDSFNAPTPGAYPNAPSVGPSGATPYPSAQTPYGAPTPYSAPTPYGAPTPYSVPTPAAGGDVAGVPSASSSKDDGWVVNDVEVRVKDGPHKDKIGVIRSVGANKVCMVVFDGGANASVAGVSLEPSRPEKKNKIKILQNARENAGALGALVGIDGTDAIVKLDNDTAGFKIVTFSTVGKYVPA